jgi:hypothetical protein
MTQYKTAFVLIIIKYPQALRKMYGLTGTKACFIFPTSVRNIPHFHKYLRALRATYSDSTRRYKSPITFPLFPFTAARTCCYSEQKIFTRPDNSVALRRFFVICITRVFTMKTAKFQLRCNNSVCAGPFQLLRAHAPTHLRGTIGLHEK